MKRERKSRLNHKEPDELETKIIACFKQITFPSICKILNVNNSKIYRTLRKFQIPVRADSDVSEGTTYGKKKEEKAIKFKSNHSKRFTKPYKTSQL